MFHTWDWRIPKRALSIFTRERGQGVTILEKNLLFYWNWRENSNYLPSGCSSSKLIPRKLSLMAALARYHLVLIKTSKGPEIGCVICFMVWISKLKYIYFLKTDMHIFTILYWIKRPCGNKVWYKKVSKLGWKFY